MDEADRILNMDFEQEVNWSWIVVMVMHSANFSWKKQLASIFFMGLIFSYSISTA
jgi:hypothetical protein